MYVRLDKETTNKNIKKLYKKFKSKELIIDENKVFKLEDIEFDNEVIEDIVEVLSIDKKNNVNEEIEENFINLEIDSIVNKIEKTIQDSIDEYQEIKIEYSDNIFHTQEESFEFLDKKIIEYNENYIEDCTKETIFLSKCIKKENIHILKKEIELKNRFDKIAKEIGLVYNLKYEIDEEVGFFPQNSQFMQNILNRLKEHKSKTRSCDKCDSVINKKFIKTTYCPICENKLFLTTKSDIERAKNLKQKILDLQSEIFEVINKREQKDNLEEWEYIMFVGIEDEKI